MKRNRSTSISRRITLVLLLSMTVLLLVLGGFLWNMVSQTTREMRAYALSMTESMTGILADKTRTIEKTATLIAQNSYVEGYFDSDDVSERTEYIRIFNSLAGNAISENPDILAICLADPDGVAITSGALLAFAMSMDDVVISFFVTGTTSNTLPLQVYSMLKMGVTPEVNALCTLMLLVVFTALGLYALLRSLLRKKA